MDREKKRGRREKDLKKNDILNRYMAAVILQSTVHK